MSNEQITIVATVKAKADKVQEVKEVLIGLLEPTRAENGCINYDLHQDSTDPCSFVFYENWTSRAALDAHIESEHISVFFGRKDELLTEPVGVQFLDKIE